MRNKNERETATLRKQRITRFIHYCVQYQILTVDNKEFKSVCTGLRYCLSKRGNTGNIRLPNDESCGMKKPTELEWACWSAVRCDVVRTWLSVALGVAAAGSDAGLAFAWVCLRSSCFFCWSSSRILRFCSSCRAVGGWKAILPKLRCFRFDVPRDLAAFLRDFCRLWLKKKLRLLQYLQKLIAL